MFNECACIYKRGDQDVNMSLFGTKLSLNSFNLLIIACSIPVNLLPKFLPIEYIIMNSSHYILFQLKLEIKNNKLI